MDQAVINVWAVLAALVVKQTLGLLWYSPVLFGRTFLEASGQLGVDLRPRLVRAALGDLAGAVVMSIVLAHVTSFAGAQGPLFGALLGLICWGGFVAPATSAPSLFEQRPLKLWALQNGYLALALAAMGAILAAWR